MFIPGIDTVEIGDCLVYDTDSVNDYVAHLKSKIANLEQQVAALKPPTPPSGTFIISRSDGFYLCSFLADNHRISYNWSPGPKETLPVTDYAHAERIVAFLVMSHDTDEYGRPHAYTIERVENPTGRRTL